MSTPPISRRGTRLAAATLAAGLTALLPAMPAVAQTSSQPSGQNDKPSYATPPPVDKSLAIPTDTKSPPNDQYVIEQKVGCVTSLNKDTKLDNKPWGQVQLRLAEVHNLGYTGKNITVAVIDTGVSEHPWLKVTGGGDYVKDGKNGLEDCDGHGTEVAGIIAANTPRDIGFKGVAPDATILSIRQTSDFYKAKSKAKPNDPESGVGNLSTLAQAIVNAASRPEVKVINISVDNCREAGPISGPEAVLQRTLQWAVEEKDKVIVTSAGNQGNGCTDPKNGDNPNRPVQIVTPPWFADYVLSVAAVQKDGSLADFSIQGPWVSLAAPGTEIISLDPAGNSVANQNIPKGSNQRQPIQGTSFAAPYVSGLAALVREKFPNLTARQVMDRIKYTAQHPATPSGRDNLVGYGMINPVAALTATVPGEDGIAPAKAVKLPPDLPTVPQKNWTPMLVALIGSGAGLTLLVITLFTMYTIRRNRGEQDSRRHGAS